MDSIFHEKTMELQKNGRIILILSQIYSEFKIIANNKMSYSGTAVHAAIFSKNNTPRKAIENIT